MTACDWDSLCYSFTAPYLNSTCSRFSPDSTFTLSLNQKYWSGLHSHTYLATAAMLVTIFCMVLDMQWSLMSLAHQHQQDITCWVHISHKIKDPFSRSRCISHIHQAPCPKERSFCVLACVSKSFPPAYILHGQFFSWHPQVRWAFALPSPACWEKLYCNNVAHTEPCFCPTDECKSNIQAPFNSVLVPNHYLREISGPSAAKCSTMFSSWVQSVYVRHLMLGR